MTIYMLYTCVHALNIVQNSKHVLNNQLYYFFYFYLSSLNECYTCTEHSMKKKNLPNLEKDRTGKSRTHKCYTLWDIERTVSQRKWIEYYRK